jgi:hypothetical protein
MFFKHFGKLVFFEIAEIRKYKSGFRLV